MKGALGAEMLSKVQAGLLLFVSPGYSSSLKTLI
jgi:hypothetical protein